MGKMESKRFLILGGMLALLVGIALAVVQNRKGSPQWKTYVGPNNSSISYPNGWTLASSANQFSLTKGAYTMTFSFPSGFGPGRCIFSDEPDFTSRTPDTLDMGESLCPGEFVQIRGNTLTFRRLNGTIYTKDKAGRFMTIPPIAYAVPTSVDLATIQEMDQILATFKLQK